MAARRVRIVPVSVFILWGFLAIPQSDGALITSFQSAFQPTVPASGWEYLWNNSGSIGSPANYTPLLATPSGHYSSDATDNFPSSPPGAFIAFQRFDDQSVGGHPGMGTLQNGSGGIERYAIAAFTLSNANLVSIANGLLRNKNPNNGGSTDGLNLKVFVNDNSVPIISAVTAPGVGSQVTFGGTLGNLNAGDKIYVAIGSRDTDLFDGFGLEYDVVSVPEPSGRSLIMVAVGLAVFVAASRNQRGDIGRSNLCRVSVAVRRGEKN